MSQGARACAHVTFLERSRGDVGEDVGGLICILGAYSTHAATFTNQAEACCKPRPRGNSCRAPHQRCTSSGAKQQVEVICHRLQFGRSYKLGDFLQGLFTSKQVKHCIFTSSKSALTPFEGVPS